MYTELIIHASRTQVIASAENPLDDQPESHGIREAVMRRNTSLLMDTRVTDVRAMQVYTTKNTHEEIYHIPDSGSRHIRVGRSHK